LYGVSIVLDILRNTQKRFLDMEFEPHKSVRQLHLAMKHAIGVIMPCVVNEYVGNSFIVIWITFGTKTKDWLVQRYEELPPILMASVEKGYSGGYIPLDNTVYIVIKEDTSEFLVTMGLADNIYEIIKLRFAEPILKDWDNKEKALFEEVGYQTWEIMPFPENPKPCLQISAFSRLTYEGEMSPLSYQDIVSQVNASSLLTCVPKNVFEVLNRSAKLCIWGYQDWEFFTMSEHYSTMSIETSMKTLYVKMFKTPLIIVLENPKTKKQIIKEKIDVNTYGDISVLAKWLGWETKEYWYVESVNGKPFLKLKDRSKNDILHLLAKYNILSPGEVNDLNYPFLRRNDLSHPDGTDIQLAFDSLQLFAEIITLTNRLWMRFLYPDRMIWENIWYKKPHWTQLSHTI